MIDDSHLNERTVASTDNHFSSGSGASLVMPLLKNQSMKNANVRSKSLQNCQRYKGQDDCLAAHQVHVPLFQIRVSSVADGFGT